MFYHGGMTLGYLVPPAKKDKQKALSKRTDHVAEAEDDARDADLPRAFVTPWHLFY